MSEKAMQQQSRVLLQKILLQASSCSAHWFEVLGHHSRPHSLARYLNMTYKQLEIILVDAGLASNPPKKKGKKSTTTVFRRDKFLTFLSALNGEEGYWDHFELNKSETTLSRDTYVLRVGENEDDLEYAEVPFEKVNEQYYRRVEAWAKAVTLKRPADDMGVGILSREVYEDVQSEADDAVFAALLRFTTYRLPHGYLEELLERTFLAESMALSRYSRRQCFYKQLTELDREGMEKFDGACRAIVDEMFPTVVRIVAEAREAIEHDSALTDEEKKKRKKKKNYIFEKECFRILSESVGGFEEMMPECVYGGMEKAEYRLCTVVLLKEIFQLVGDLLQESLGVAMGEASGGVASSASVNAMGEPSRGVASSARVNASAVPPTISEIVDETGEAHRFFASACVNQVKVLGRAIQRWVTNREARKSAQDYICNLTIKRKDLAEFYEAFGIGDVDERYNNNYLLALDKGDLRLVSPECLDLAHDLLRVCRASIDKNSISTLGKEAMVVGYKRFLDSETVKSWLEQVRGDRVVKKYAVIPILRKVFHSRAEVEFKKFRRENTDRSVNKRKATTQREALKSI